MDTSVGNIQIKLNLRDKGRLRAQVEVIFGQTIETKGWRVMQSNRLHPKYQEYIFIQPPSYKTAKGWRPIVWTDDKELYTKIEDEIYDAYSKAKILSGMDKDSPSPETETVDVNELPI